MERSGPQPRRRQPTPQRKPPSNFARFGALGALLAAIVIFLVVILGSTGGSKSQKATETATKTQRSKTTATTPRGSTTTVPILAYNVINSQPAGSTAPASLYVPADEFSAQMQGLKAAGYHAITLDQLEAAWTHGASLGSGKPIVITFDGGYASQFANALPVLQRLGWKAVADLPVNVLPSSDGGISDSQVHGLISAGWQIGVQGSATANLTGLSSSGVQSELTTERQTVDSHYGVTTHWLAYPNGRYNPTVSGAVKPAGFTGALTTVAGWASPKADITLLPRIEVVGGTSASQLVSQISSAQGSTAVPTSSQ
jgi:peptidoglycan/xylan/chitin deacetylase (PgdA/CDA1 family)